MAAFKGHTDAGASSRSQELAVPFNSVQVSNIPQWITEDKLTIHFQKTSNGGGDVSNITFTTNPSVAVVTFNNPKCASDVLRKAQITDKGEFLKVELYTEVFGEVNAVLPVDILHNLRGPLLDKIKKETGVYLKRDNLSICGTWDQVKAARRIIQCHLSPDICANHRKSSGNNTASLEAATYQPYNPDRYQVNSGDVGRPSSTYTGVDTRGERESQGEDMEWEDGTGASPSNVTSQPSASARIPSHHIEGSDVLLKDKNSYIPYMGKNQSLTLPRKDEEDQSKNRGKPKASSRSAMEGSSGPHSPDPQVMRQPDETSHLSLGATNVRRSDEGNRRAEPGDQQRKGTHSSAGFPGPDSQPVRVRASIDRGNSMVTSRHDTNSEDNSGNAQTTTSDQGDDHFTVDPWALHILQQTKRRELQNSLTQNHVRFLPSKAQTSVQFLPINRSQPSNLEKARDTFIDLYQDVFCSLKYEDMDISSYGIPSNDAKKSLERVKEAYSLVQMTEVEDRIFSFYGVESDVREARKAFCELLNLPLHRRERLARQNSATKNDKPTTTQPVPGTSSSPRLHGDQQFECYLNGVKVTVMKGDITKQHVDVIVNASDATLTHGGGVAAAIVRAGGSLIQSECSEYFYSQGPLKTTECMWTTAGHLPCKHIIHAAGPNYNNASTLQKLKETCINIFAMAVDLKATSVAIPAISTGMYGVPADVCAKAIFDTIMDLTLHGTTSLCDICIIDIKLATAQDIATHFKRSSGSSHAAYSRRRKTPSSTATSYTGSSGGHKAATTSYSRSYADATRSEDGASGFGPVISPSNGKQLHTQSSTKSSAASGPAKDTDDQDDTCPICLDVFKNPKTIPQCKHKFCKSCLDQALKVSSQCPICKTVVGTLTGTQPQRGTMKDKVDKYTTLSGYPNCGTIVIDYHFPSGTQGPEHPNPGRPYYATSRRAYLPDNREGREVLALLKRAFNQWLVFTVGTSSSTGLSDNIVWNDIHHKTNIHGGPTNYGYPDPDYLRRVKEELAAKGIK
ncbi:uncharacterized protein [Branchiostoma lanceolatum]|uniref:uncharacterized protein n=1 Tax=Branchiostoma lanceolatum TaxID=7740 RepID=UPI0034563FD0